MRAIDTLIHSVRRNSNLILMRSEKLRLPSKLFTLGLKQLKQHRLTWLKAPAHALQALGYRKPVDRLVASVRAAVEAENIVETSGAPKKKQRNARQSKSK